MLLGYSFEPRPNNCVLDTAGLKVLFAGDQLMGNTKTVHFSKILLAQAERAYQN